MIWINDGYFSYDKLWLDHFGFNGTKQRRAHIECLIRNFDAIALQISKQHEKFQVWIMINEHNGKDDCIMLHTQNPLTSYPHQYKVSLKASNFKNRQLNEIIERQVDFKRFYGTHIFLNDKGQEQSENYCILFKSERGDSVV